MEGAQRFINNPFVRAEADRKRMKRTYFQLKGDVGDEPMRLPLEFPLCIPNPDPSLMNLQLRLESFFKSNDQNVELLYRNFYESVEMASSSALRTTEAIGALGGYGPNRGDPVVRRKKNEMLAIHNRIVHQHAVFKTEVCELSREYFKMSVEVFWMLYEVENLRMAMNSFKETGGSMVTPEWLKYLQHEQEAIHGERGERPHQPATAESARKDGGEATGTQGGEGGLKRANEEPAAGEVGRKRAKVQHEQPANEGGGSKQPTVEDVDPAESSA